MVKKKLVISLVIFSILMVLTSIIKTQTRLIEKNIFNYEKKIANLNNNIHESQVDFYYLTSPDYITKKIQNYSDQEYQSINYSKIYFSLNQFIEEQKKTTKSYKNEKKIQKK